MVSFFSQEEEARIIDAIRQAEACTTGEIRVHLETDATTDAITESQKVFHQLGMHQTKLRNGVLILLEINRKEFAIIGDVGIDKVVTEDFWKEERDLMQTYFRNRDFVGGICLAIQQIGAKLRRYFPTDPGEENENELPDTISVN